MWISSRCTRLSNQKKKRERKGKRSERSALIIVAISRNTFDPEVNDGLESSSILCMLDAASQPDFIDMWTPSVSVAEQQWTHTSID